MAPQSDDTVAKGSGKLPLLEKLATSEEVGGALVYPQECTINR